MSEIRKLKGNIILVTEHIPHAMSAAVGIWARTGSVNETEEISGISHFIEHMMFKGTKSRTAKQIAEDVDRIGGQFNAFTGKETTCYYIKTLSSNLKKGIEIIFDMFTNSLFDPEEMEREKRVIYEEMKMIKDAPDEDAQETIGTLVYEGNPLGKTIIGTEESLSAIDRDALTGYLGEQYTKDSVVISIAGNFDEEKIATFAEERLDYLRDTKTEADPGSEVYAPRFKTKVKDIEQSHICLATRTVPWNDPRYYDLMVVNAIMGGSMSSRLFQNVRERRGLAYSVYSANSGYRYRGTYNIYAGCSHDKVQETIDAIKYELGELASHGVTDDELAKAKEQLKSSYIFGQESVLSRMLSIGKKAAIYGVSDDSTKTIEAIDAVTKKSVGEIISLISDIDNYSAALVTGRDADIEAMIKKNN